MDKTEYSWGRSKIFIRSPKCLFDLEDRRRLKTIMLATKLQAMYRGWKAKCQFQKMRQSQIKIASKYKGFRKRREFLAVRDNCLVVTSFFRMWRERQRLASFLAKKKEQKAAILIAAYMKGWLTRKRTHLLFRY